MHEGILNFADLVHKFFAIGSTRYDDYIYALNEAITAPMIRDLGYKLEDTASGIYIPKDNPLQLNCTKFHLIPFRTGSI